MSNVYSISICGRMTLDMHSLNNEGGEGNQTQTRMVTIVDGNGEIKSVNAISGDMFKHIQAQQLFYQSISNGVSLCEGCKIFNANRIAIDEDFMKENKKKTDVEFIDAMIKKCAIDDMEGNLITEGNRNTPRKSVVEFGWIIGIPETTRTDSYFHVKYVSDATTHKKGEKSNIGQNIFYRPASSGVYAIVLNLDIFRIGFNEISMKYAIDDESRKKRFKALLSSVLYTFIQPKGAMRNTQNPHILDFNGVVTISAKDVPAPTVSPLSDNYIQEVERVCNALNSIESQSVSFKPFESTGEMAEILSAIINNDSPYKLTISN